MKICIDSIVKCVFLCLGSLIVLYSFSMLVIMNYNIGISAFFILGFVFCLVGFFYNKAKNLTVFKFFLVIIVLLWISFTCICIYTTSYGNDDNSSYQEDAIIVLGCGIRGNRVTPQLASRLDMAIDYYMSNEKIIVVSGGMGPQENITEALAMEQYLIDRGIPKDKILKEEMSTSTYTNLINSKKILDCYFDSYYNVVIVTSNYHIYRTQNIANDIGLSSTHIHANIKWYEYPIRCFRENVAIIKYWLDNCFQ